MESFTTKNAWHNLQYRNIQNQLHQGGCLCDLQEHSEVRFSNQIKLHKRYISQRCYPALNFWVSLFYQAMLRERVPEKKIFFLNYYFCTLCYLLFPFHFLVVIAQALTAFFPFLIEVSWRWADGHSRTSDFPFIDCTVQAATAVSSHILPWQWPLGWTTQTPSAKPAAVHSSFECKPGTLWVTIKNIRPHTPALGLQMCALMRHRNLHRDPSFRI